MPGYQGSEYASEYTRVLIIPVVVICQVSKYIRVLNIPGLRRVRNMREYA